MILAHPNTARGLLTRTTLRLAPRRPELVEHVGKIAHLGSAIVEKWSGSSNTFTAEMEKLAGFLAQSRQRDDTQAMREQEQAVQKARHLKRQAGVVKIQALWRGKASRRKWKGVVRGIVVLQRLWRRRVHVKALNQTRKKKASRPPAAAASDCGPQPQPHLHTGWGKLLLIEQHTCLAHSTPQHSRRTCSAQPPSLLRRRPVQATPRHL